MTEEWLEPWAPLTADEADQRERQLAAGSPLAGARAIAARSDDVEDTLYAAGDRFCVVNGGSVQWYDSFEEFREACMVPDHLEYTDDDV